MKKSIILIFYLLLCACAMAQNERDRMREHRGRGGSNPGIIVYKDDHFNGASMVITSDWDAGSSPGWNDQISSIRIPPGYKVQVFEHDRDGGRSMTLTSDWTVSGGNLFFNDIISSLRILEYPQGNTERTLPTPAPAPAPVMNESENDGIRVYQDSNFQGPQLTLFNDWNVATGQNPDWNDRISSIRIPRGMILEVFADENFSGASLRLDRDWTVSDGDLSFNDVISSIRMVPRQPHHRNEPPMEQPVAAPEVPVQTDYVVRTLRGDYNTGETVLVEYSGFKGSGGEWINITAAGKPDDDWGKFQYVNNAAGQLRFDMRLPRGDYEVRAYRSATDYTVAGRFKFSVR